MSRTKNIGGKRVCGLTVTIEGGDYFIPKHHPYYKALKAVEHCCTRTNSVKIDGTLFSTCEATRYAYEKMRGGLYAPCDIADLFNVEGK